jgi:hypothetical protein
VDVRTLVGDMAYCDGDVREAVEAQGVELVAKVPPTSNAGRYPKPTLRRARPSQLSAAATTSDARATTDHKRRPVLRLWSAPQPVRGVVRVRCV